MLPGFCVSSPSRPAEKAVSSHALLYYMRRAHQLPSSVYTASLGAYLLRGGFRIVKKLVDSSLNIVVIGLGDDAVSIILYNGTIQDYKGMGINKPEDS